MNTPKFITIATVLLFLVINVNAQITIDGTVKDSEFNPISNALVEIIEKTDTNNIYRDFTDASGNFYIANISDTEGLPKKLLLSQNYPNPFNPSTTIKYSIPNSSVMLNLPDRQAGSFQHLSSEIPGQARNDKSFVILNGVEESFVKLKVYDILGREVATLVNEQQNPGYYEVEWNAFDTSSGIYLYQLKTNSYNEKERWFCSDNV